MATVITRTLKASGGDYSTIKSWLSAMLSAYPNLVSSDVILELQCYNDWPSGLDEDFVDFKSGFTTDADHYFRIVAADGEGYTGVAGTGFMFNTTSIQYTFYSRSKHVVFDGIEVSAPNASEPMFGASSNTIIKNCILHDIDSSGFSTSSGAQFENCIAYLTAPSSSGNIGTAFKGSKLTNVTAYISELSGGFNGDIVFHTCECTNVYMYHNRAKTTYNSFFGCTGDYNVALAINGDIPGANSFFITDDSDLEDPDNFDFRLKSTSPLMTAGENGGPIGAVFSSEPAGVELDLKSSVANNLTSKVTLNKASSLSASSSFFENKTNNIELLALKRIDLSSSLAKNISSNIELSKSSSLIVKGSIAGNYHQSIEIGGSSSISFGGVISKNYSQSIEQVKIAEISLNGSVAKNLSKRINLDSSSSILLNSSVSKNLTGSVELKRIAKLSLNASKAKNLSFSIGFKSKLNLYFDGSVSKNLSGSVRFIVGNVPDISPYDIKAFSKTNKIIAYSATASISAKSKTTVYSCTITK